MVLTPHPDGHLWKLPQCILDVGSKRVRHEPGCEAKDILRIPTEWPLPDE
jgi:hypothetical protein